MPTIRSLCLLLAMCLSVSLAQEDGYETFPSVPGSRYKLYTIHETWGEALSLCQGDGGGSHLVVINSQEEADVVKIMFDRIGDPTGIPHVAVGINDIVQEGNWVTVLGGLVSTSGYNLWASGQPDDFHGSEDCGLVTREVKYYDGNCGYLYPFICEKPEV